MSFFTIGDRTFFWFFFVSLSVVGLLFLNPVLAEEGGPLQSEYVKLKQMEKRAAWASEEGSPVTKMRLNSATNHFVEQQLGEQLSKLDFDLKIIAPSLRVGASKKEGTPALQDVQEIGKKFKKYIVHRTLSASDRKQGDPAPRMMFESKSTDIPLSRHSKVMATYSTEGKPLSVRTRRLPEKVDAFEPKFESFKALRVAMLHAREQLAERVKKLPSSASPAEVEGWKTLPLASSSATLEIWVDDKKAGRLAWTLEISSREPSRPFGFQYWISATGNEPQVLLVENLFVNEHHGSVRGSIWKGSSTSSSTGTGGVTTNLRIPNITVIRNNAESVISSDSNIEAETGLFRFQTGSGSAQLTGKLRGPYCEIYDPSNPLIAPSVNGQVGDEIDINFDALGNEHHTAQITAFYWVGFGNKMVQEYLGTSIHPRLRTYVNLSGDCNAYFGWDNLGNVSLGFYRSFLSCPNTAFPDIVLHEFGHGIDYWHGGIENFGLSEGLADATSILGTRQSIVGRNWIARDAADTTIVYPPTGGVHHQGRVFAGFTWDFIQQLMKDGKRTKEEAYDLATEVILGGIAREPSYFSTAVEECFLVVDADEDLTTIDDNPLYYELWYAADSRDFPIVDQLPRPQEPTGPTNPTKTITISPYQVVADQFSSGKNTENGFLIASKIKVRLTSKADLYLQASASISSDQDDAEVQTAFAINDDSSTRDWQSYRWPESVRSTTLARAGHHASLATSYLSKDLEPGEYTFYWKIWTDPPAQINLSAGTCTVQAFVPSSQQSANPPVESSANPGTPTSEHVLREIPHATIVPSQ